MNNIYDASNKEATETTLEYFEANRILKNTMPYKVGKTTRESLLTFFLSPME